MAKSEGKKFEEDFKKSCDSTEGVFYYRIKDGSAWGNSDIMRFQVKNDFDNFVYSEYGLCLFELKSVKGKSLPLSNIRQNQIDGLNKAINKNIKKIYAGFIINFRDCQETYFMSIIQFNDFIKNNERKSIPIDYCRNNCLLVESEQLRTRFRYNIKKFLKDMEA